MNKMMISQMNVDQLERHIEKLAFVSGTEAVYARLKTSDDGKRLVAALQDELDVVRNCYSAIIPHDPAAATVLAGLQAEERQLKSMLNRILNSEKFSKEVDEEVKYAQSCLTEKKKLTREQQ